ncbi:hypothetical protein L150_04226 [Candida albicans Ca529L]|nr:hypothetical protein L150_04226 [Candida albicans Ca529L]
MPSLSSLMARVFLLYFALFRSGHKNCTRLACEDGRDWVAFILCFPSKNNRDFGVQIIVIPISFNARDIMRRCMYSTDIMSHSGTITNISITQL